MHSIVLKWPMSHWYSNHAKKYGVGVRVICCLCGVPDLTRLNGLLLSHISVASKSHGDDFKLFLQEREHMHYMWLICLAGSNDGHAMSDGECPSHDFPCSR